MNQPHGGIAHRRRVDRMTAADKAAALHKVIACLQLGDKFRHILDRVLVVAVDGQDALVAAIQRKIDSHAQLCALLAWASLGQQRVHMVKLQRVVLHASVGRAAVADNDVAHAVDARCLGAAQLGQDAGALVDNGDQQAVIAAAALKFGGGKIRHAVQLPALIFDHANTSAI